MDLCKYQEKARSTAIYLDIEKNKMIYPALGIVGECGEVAEKIKKLLRDDDCEMTPDRKVAIVNELGDCCWYIANICCDTNLDLGMMHDMIGFAIIQRVKKLETPQIVLRMITHAANVAAALDSWYYDFDSRLNEYDRFTSIPNDLSWIIACIEEIGERCDTSLEEICTINIDKLMKRKQNGTLQGDGDTR